ncbi:hypothetical protein [Sphingomonas bacterium]|uniref:hypothetical protein n=1 Tax=Sphingomonas bacterium TaxID=1895847 RepID=UPI0020C6E95F|nr:hypothetical protein [Sphingomonas bacterium]
MLFTTRKDVTASALQGWSKANGIADIALPKDVRVIDALPVLGTGKLDYGTMAESAVLGSGTRVTPGEA